MHILVQFVGHLYCLVVLVLRDLAGVQHLLDLLLRVSPEGVPELLEL